MDAETMRLPDASTLPGIVLGILYSGISLGLFRVLPPALNLPWGFATELPSEPAQAVKLIITGMVASAIWAALAALLLLLIRWLHQLVRHHEGLGLGDIKLLAMIAAWLGPAPTILTLLLGALATALYAIVSVALSRRRRSFATTRLPLGSFLSAAALYTLFAGQPIIAWYMHFYGVG
jgi:leader peptidase (prepilin peptidase) / N-methyltransferase